MMKGTTRKLDVDGEALQLGGWQQEIRHKR